MLYQALVNGKLTHAKDVKKHSLAQCPLCGITVQAFGPGHSLNTNSWAHPANECIHGQTTPPGTGHRHKEQE